MTLFRLRSLCYFKHTICNQIEHPAVAHHWLCNGEANLGCAGAGCHWLAVHLHSWYLLTTTHPEAQTSRTKIWIVQYVRWPGHYWQVQSGSRGLCWPRNHFSLATKQNKIKQHFMVSAIKCCWAAQWLPLLSLSKEVVSSWRALAILWPCTWTYCNRTLLRVPFSVEDPSAVQFIADFN